MLAGRWKTICVATAVLKTDSKCSVIMHKLRFFACFCLASAASKTFFNGLLKGRESRNNCHFEHGEKSMLLITKDSSLCSEWQKWVIQSLLSYLHWATNDWLLVASAGAAVFQSVDADRRVERTMISIQPVSASLPASIPLRRIQRHKLQLHKRYGVRKEASVRYRTWSDRTDLC